MCTIRVFLYRKHIMSKLILASASPRRKELLKNLGYDFSIEVCDLEEKSDKTKPYELVMDLAKTKAKAIMDMHSGEDVVVLGADTIVVNEEEVLGKPRDLNHAKEMISFLQGKTHQVYTGVCLFWNEENKTDALSFYEKTDVMVYPMTQEEIETYVETKECLDKAGSYAIQGLFSPYIQGICGDYNNVVGLPVSRIYQEMKKLGLDITND